MDDLVFSPDGARVAYVREDRIEEWVVDGKTWTSAISLHWCDSSAPARQSSLPLETVWVGHAGSGSIPVDLVWSPDSARIGVLTPHELTIVDAASGRKTEIRDGTIGSFAWLSASEVIYCARRKRGGAARRVICRQDLDSGHRMDVAVLPEAPAGSLLARESWAPSGKYVIFVDPDYRGRYACVNALDGTIRRFGGTNACSRGVAWAPDSSRAFCVGRQIGPDDVYEAHLLDPATGTTVDCSPEFQRTFAGHMPSLIDLWTPDGKYVLVNALGINGHLVQPSTWQAVPVGRLVAPRFAPPKLDTIRPWVFRLPVPGWVGITPTGNIGSSPVLYAADYAGRRIVPLREDYPRVISPDGTKAADIDKDGRITVRSIGSWPEAFVEPSGSGDAVE